MYVQVCACSPGIPGRVRTTQFTGTLTRRTEIAVDSGTEAVKAMIIAFSHERNVEVGVSHHQELVRVINHHYLSLIFVT